MQMCGTGLPGHDLGSALQLGLMFSHAFPPSLHSPPSNSFLLGQTSSELSAAATLFQGSMFLMGVCVRYVVASAHTSSSCCLVKWLLNSGRQTLLL